MRKILLSFIPVFLSGAGIAVAHPGEPSLSHQLSHAHPELWLLVMFTLVAIGYLIRTGSLKKIPASYRKIKSRKTGRITR